MTIVRFQIKNSKIFCHKNHRKTCLKNIKVCLQKSCSEEIGSAENQIIRQKKIKKQNHTEINETIKRNSEKITLQTKKK